MRVLAYHSVSDATADAGSDQFAVTSRVFREHLKLLKASRFNFVTGSQFANAVMGVGRLPSRSVLITLDDGYADQFHTAAPILADMGVPAVVFVVTALIGRSSDWATKTTYPLCGVAELREFARYGIEIGAHSRTHQDLVRASTRDLFDEVAGSRADLEALGFPSPPLFAFPYGAHDARVRDAVRRAGFALAFATHPRSVHPGDDPFQVPRFSVRSHHGGLRFRAWLELGGRFGGLYLSNPAAPPRPQRRPWVILPRGKRQRRRW